MNSNLKIYSIMVSPVAILIEVNTFGNLLNPDKIVKSLDDLKACFSDNAIYQGGADGVCLVTLNLDHDLTLRSEPAPTSSTAIMLSTEAVNASDDVSFSMKRIAEYAITGSFDDDDPTTCGRYLSYLINYGVVPIDEHYDSIFMFNLFGNDDNNVVISRSGKSDSYLYEY